MLGFVGVFAGVTFLTAAKEVISGRPLVGAAPQKANLVHRKSGAW